MNVRMTTATATRKRWYQRWSVRIALGFLALLIGAGFVGANTPPIEPATAVVADAPAPVPVGPGPPVVAPVVPAPAPEPAPVVEPVEPVAPARVVASDVGSPEWFLASMRDADPTFDGVTDAALISAADDSCDYRARYGPSGAAIKEIAWRAGFTEAQADTFSTRTFVYCTAQANR